MRLTSQNLLNHTQSYTTNTDHAVKSFVKSQQKIVRVSDTSEKDVGVIQPPREVLIGPDVLASVPRSKSPTKTELGSGSEPLEARVPLITQGPDRRPRRTTSVFEDDNAVESSAPRVRPLDQTRKKRKETYTLGSVEDREIVERENREQTLKN